MGSRITARKIAVSTSDRSDDLPAVNEHTHAGPNGIALQLRIDGADHQPMSPARGVISIESSGPLDVADQQIDVAVAVNIPNGQAPRDLNRRAQGGDRIMKQLKGAGPIVEIEEVGLGVAIPGRTDGRTWPGIGPHHPSVDHENVEITIQLGVEGGDAETGVRDAGRSQPTGAAGVLKPAAAASVAIQRVRLTRQVRHEEIDPRVVVQIGRDNTHSRFGLTVNVQRHPHDQGDIAESPVGLIQPELIGVPVVGNVDILPAVVVEVLADDPQPRGRHRRHPRPLAHVAERAIAVVMQQHIRDRRKRLRSAIDRSPRVVIAVIELVEVQVPCDIQVQPAVTIVVKEHGGTRPAVYGDARRVGDVLERPVSAIAVQPVPPIVGHIHVQITVVVDIADGDAHPVPAIAQAALLGHVHERPVRFLPIHAIDGTLSHPCLGKLVIAVGQIDVQIAVVVVVEQGRARQHDLRQQQVTGRPGLMHEVEPDVRGDLGKPLLHGLGAGRVRPWGVGGGVGGGVGVRRASGGDQKPATEHHLKDPSDRKRLGEDIACPHSSLPA